MRPTVGTQRSPGDVRPVTNRTLLVVAGLVVLAVLLALWAVLWAGTGTSQPSPAPTNAPTHVSTIAPTAPSASATP